MEYIYLIAMFALGMLIAGVIGLGGLYASFNFYQKDKGMKRSKIVARMEEEAERKNEEDE